MGMLRMMSRRGDERLSWDLRKAEEGDPEALAAIREAERIFHDARALGATAFTVEIGCLPKRIEQFDPEAVQIVLAPRVIGGSGSHVGEGKSR